MSDEKLTAEEQKAASIANQSNVPKQIAAQAIEMFSKRDAQKDAK